MAIDPSRFRIHLQLTPRFMNVFFAVTSVDEEAFEAAALIIILRLWRIVRVVNGKYVLKLRF